MLENLKKKVEPTLEAQTKIYTLTHTDSLSLPLSLSHSLTYIHIYIPYINMDLHVASS